jgi:branched-chain amino acid transport system ATP-binding protein
MVARVRRMRVFFEEAEQLLEDAGLSSVRGSKVRELSYGDQRMLEIVLALATKPLILALDEPTAGLSKAETSRVAQMLQSLDRRITVLLIEHDVGVALEVCEHVTVLHYGAVIADGPREQVKNDRKVQEIYLGIGGGTGDA